MSTATADSAMPDAPTADVLVSVRNLKTYYGLRGSFRQRLLGREAGSVRAVDDVTLDIRRGEVLGLVGESGSGKTTLGRTLLGLVPATEGSVRFEGEEITTMSERELRRLRRRMQIVFQDPHASLNPAMTIQQSVGHPLEIHGIAKGAERRSRVAEALETVGLAPAEQFIDKYPSDLSGGQKQRAVIARAIILNPMLLVADEPVSMLDMSVRAKILELMLESQARVRIHLPLHHARPGDREVLLRPHRDPVPRACCRTWAFGGDLRRSEAPVHEGAPTGDPGTGPASQRSA